MAPLGPLSIILLLVSESRLSSQHVPPRPTRTVTHCQLLYCDCLRLHHPQAVGSLAHLAGEPGCAAALVALPGLLEGGVALLGCGQQEAAAVCCALLSTLSSAGGWGACRAMGRCPGLVEALGAALGSGSIQVGAPAVWPGVLALPWPRQPWCTRDRWRAHWLAP